jgi:hypothetical protein
MSYEGYGEHIIHLQYMNFAKHVPVRGMYCGKKGFWLSMCQGNELVQRIQVNWEDKGSKTFVRNFFLTSNPEWFNVEELCEQLSVKIADPLQFNSKVTAFLGAGGMGRVLSVVPESFHDLSKARKDDLMALKVVVMKNAKDLEREYEILIKHARTCGCQCLVQPVMGSFKVTMSNKPKLCGYLMTPVGDGHVLASDVLQNKNLLRKVIMALYTLHIHSPSICHGDPRLPNLIINGIELFWIDVANSNSSSLFYQKQFDMTTLIRSINSDLLTENVNDLIDEYSTNTNNDTIESLLTEIFKLIKDQMLLLRAK